MRLLLDTHALLWFVAGDPTLSPRALAQSLEEGLTLATTEHELFARYGALVLW